jgi:CHAD domain-containing protein
MQMTYRFSVARPLKDAVPSIAAEQLDAALMRLSSADRGPKAIHDARRHFKRTRALLELVKPAIRGRVARNSQKLLSSAARMLSASRDAQVAVGAAEALEKEFGGSRRGRLFADLKSWLMARRDLADEKLAQSQLDSALKELAKARASLAKLNLRKATIEDLLTSASKTYRRGRHAMKAALAASENEALHDWRKQVQRHWRHTLLLEEAWPKESKARTKLARKLSDDLGMHHDLAVLREMILANPSAFRSPSDIKTLCRCIEKKQAALTSEAALRGERLYAEKPKAFLKRLRAYWQSIEQRHAAEVA